MSAAILVALAVASTSSKADQTYRLDIPAGPLAVSLGRLSDATGVDVGTTGTGLEGVRTSAVAGRYTVAQALDRMLRNLDFRASRIAANGWRIEPVRRPLPRALAPPQLPSTEILVSASKRATPLARFPGTAHVIDAMDLEADIAPVGTDAVIEQTAALTSTARGVGRNKLFIRGIADSAFTGNSQTTTAQYLDDARLTYNTPDPGLILFDVRSVEVLEGPQGTLYGTGTLGGVVRVTTQPPDLERTSGAVTAGAALTAHGSGSGDAEAMINLPLIGNRLALRLVGYGLSDGGYIDDPSHLRHNINHLMTLGGRLAFRWEPDADWVVDIRGVGQNIDARDSQWADGSGAPLVRTDQLPQPYRSTFLLGDVAVSHELGTVHLVSTTAITRQELVENYDASDGLFHDYLSTYQQQNVTRLISHETRLSSGEAGQGWLIGAGIVSNRVEIERNEISTLSAITPSQRLSHVAFEATLFGQASLRLPLGFTGTAGARLAHSHLGERATSGASLGGVFRSPGTMNGDRDWQTHTRLTPAASLSVSPARHLLLFVRYDQGFRPGGLAIGNGAVLHFESDRLASIEVGARIGDPTTPVALSLAFAHTRWRHVQADMTTYGGLPITANIGDATISSLELSGQWRLFHGLRWDASALINRNRLQNGGVSIAIVPQSELPNVAKFGASTGMVWEAQCDGARLRLESRLRYIGKSRLGVGPVLGVPQGDYLDGEFVVGWTRADRGVSLRLTNPFDSVANRFALGTPFRFYDRQATPLRPRTLRLGFNTRF